MQVLISILSFSVLDAADLCWVTEELTLLCSSLRVGSGGPKA